jgi:ABC-type multidrug transport system fused ATPase/permease subunit
LIGERAVMLSDEQQQRLAIARAQGRAGVPIVPTR